MAYIVIPPNFFCTVPLIRSDEIPSPSPVGWNNTLYLWDVILAWSDISYPRCSLRLIEFILSNNVFIRSCGAFFETVWIGVEARSGGKKSPVQLTDIIILNIGELQPRTHFPLLIGAGRLRHSSFSYDSRIIAQGYDGRKRRFRFSRDRGVKWNWNR